MSRLMEEEASGMAGKFTAQAQLTKRFSFLTVFLMTSPFLLFFLYFKILCLF